MANLAGLRIALSISWLILLSMKSFDGVFVNGWNSARMDAVKGKRSFAVQPHAMSTPGRYTSQASSSRLYVDIPRPGQQLPIMVEQASSSLQGDDDILPPLSKKDETLAMPWSDVQGWALRDNLPKYTIMIPIERKREIANNNKVENATETDGAMVVALWRTMLKEVPELAGYPIDFLQKMHAKQIETKETKMLVTPQLLPYLEDYSFASAGGVSGKVYGVPGLADGTSIETSTVTNIEVTLPQGFIRTSDGKAAYELGRPMREVEFGSGDVNQKSMGKVTAGSMELLKNVNNAAASTTSNASEVLDDADGMLLRLGASTGILLAGATAINLLSHHLTVNVFWV